MANDHYTWNTVPHGRKTAKQWLKLHRRLKKGAKPVGTFTLVFDKPRSRPKYAEAVPPEECQKIWEQLQLIGPDPSLHYGLYRLDRAGQLAVCNLYDRNDTEAITAFREAEAQRLLGYMVWDHCHEDDYITEATVDGRRVRATWKSEISDPNLTEHLSGQRYFGVKKGRMTMQVTVDCDRHGGNVPAEEHVAKVLEVGEVLKSHFPEYRFAPEINTRNGSVKFFGWLHDFTRTPEAEQIGERGVRQALRYHLPEYDFTDLEIFPSNSPQIFAPLRADKTMVIANGPVPKANRYRMTKVNGKRTRRYYETYSCANCLNWIYFSDQPYDSVAFERVLREAVARCPDRPEAQKPARRPKAKRKGDRPGGMGDIGKLKGRCTRTLINFWSELERPEDDTVGKFVIVSLRILKYEGLSADQAVEWVEERLQALHYKEFSHRLTDDFAEIQRVMAYAVEAVWRNNGYQKDPESSDAKLRASVEAWARKGFRLHDPSTWRQPEPVAVPDFKLVWTSDLLNVVPELASAAHTTAEQAKVLLEKVLAFVQSHNELAESMVGRLLEQVGIKGRSRQKQHDVRRLLVEKGLLVKQFNYFQDKATGYRHGNFYVCGLAVSFEHEAKAARVFFAAPHLPVSILIRPCTRSLTASTPTTGWNFSWKAGG
jgi:hypothetical protein